MDKRPIGEILLAEGLIARDQLDEALSLFAKDRIETGEQCRFGRTLIKHKFLKEKDLYSALARQLDIPFFERIDDDMVSAELLKKFPIAFAKSRLAFPLSETDKEVVFVVEDPFDAALASEITVYLGKSVRLLLGSRTEITDAIHKYYVVEIDEAVSAIENLETEDISNVNLEEIDDLLGDTVDEAPIQRYVNSIIVQAVKDRVSDIHIEPFQQELMIRYRIDGILYNYATPPKRMQSRIISRVKTMADMNIAEHRRPQDGKIRRTIGGKDIDIRVSVLPTLYGERVVMRLLDKSSIMLGLGEIGLGQSDLAMLLTLIEKSHGILLVTGPTGSGKTTTLYGAISSINSSDKNIITVEDPIEYQLKGVGQIQVNPKVDLTFANGLRTILRQDPDVIMVGEIRDAETAEIAIQASLTGHLVFSTLHTNDAASAPVRLIDMGVEPYLVSSSLIGIVAQRLLRTICKDCIDKLAVTESELAKIGLSYEKLGREYIFAGRGCPTCMNTGYRGRTGSYEVIVIDEGVRQIINRRGTSFELKSYAAENLGFKTLREDGAHKVATGVTTMEELLRVTQEDYQGVG